MICLIDLARDYNNVQLRTKYEDHISKCAFFGLCKITATKRVLCIAVSATKLDLENHRVTMYTEYEANTLELKNNMVRVWKNISNSCTLYHFLFSHHILVTF